MHFTAKCFVRFAPPLAGTEILTLVVKNKTHLQLSQHSAPLPSPSSALGLGHLSQRASDWSPLRQQGQNNIKISPFNLISTWAE